MGTIAEKLAYLAETKDKIREAIVATGVEVPEGTAFRAYAELISGGTGGGSSVRVTNVAATEDGTYTITFEDGTELYGIVDFDTNGYPIGLTDGNNVRVEFSNGWPVGVTHPDGHTVTIEGV